MKLRFHATRYHQITSYGPQGTEHAVVYDTAGRMASRVIKTGATAAAAKSESYFFDAVNRLTRVVVHAGTGVYVTGAAQESTTRHWYGSEGQRVRTQVTAGTTTSNTHQFFAEVEVRDNEMTKYYFAGGLRIAGRVVTPSTTSSAADLLAGAPFRGITLSPGVAVGLALVLLLLLLSPGLRGDSRWRVLLVPTRAFATAAFFWLALLPPGLAKAALPGDVTLWHYHLDHLGSTHSITDASGNLYRQTRTTAYGEVRGRYDGSGNVVAAEVALRHEFTGYQSEEKSGLQYAGARYYLPELGVFTSHDPAGQFPSPYAYGPGDPINGTDPNGSFFLVLGFALFTAVATATARALYRGIKTGNWGAAATGLAIDIGLAAASYAADKIIQKAIEKYGSNELMAAYLIARTGYAVYSNVQSIRRGDTFSKVVAGLSLAAIAYGFTLDESGRTSQEVVNGQPGEDLPVALRGAKTLAEPQAGIPAGVGAGAAAAARGLWTAAKWIWAGAKWVGSKAADAARQGWAKGKAGATTLALRYAPWLVPASQLQALKNTQYGQIWGRAEAGARKALELIREGHFTRPDGVSMGSLRSGLEWYRRRLVAKPAAIKPGNTNDLRGQFIGVFQQNRY